MESLTKMGAARQAGVGWILKASLEIVVGRVASLNREGPIPTLGNNLFSLLHPPFVTRLQVNIESVLYKFPSEASAALHRHIHQLSERFFFSSSLSAAGFHVSSQIVSIFPSWLHVGRDDCQRLCSDPLPVWSDRKSVYLQLIDAFLVAQWCCRQIDADTYDWPHGTTCGRRVDKHCVVLRCISSALSQGKFELIWATRRGYFILLKTEWTELVISTHLFASCSLPMHKYYITEGGKGQRLEGNHSETEGNEEHNILLLTVYLSSQLWRFTTNCSTWK